MLPAYDLAIDLLDRGYNVQAIPVENKRGERDVALVALDLHPQIRGALTHPDRSVRVRATTAVLVKAHSFLEPRGLRFVCHFST